MGEQSELEIDKQEFDEQSSPQWKECSMCGEKYFDNGENGCCNIDS